MNIHEIITAVEQVTGVTYDDMIRDAGRQSGGRWRGSDDTITNAKHLCFVFAYEILGMSYTNIAKHFKMRQHGSVISGIKNIQNRQDTSRRFKEKYVNMYLAAKHGIFMNDESLFNLCNNCIQL